jgi:hypothetical protein
MNEHSTTHHGLDLNRLNPEQIAYCEKAGWEAYYDRDWPRAFGLMVRLIESQFHVPFPRSLLAALHVVRASIAFAPRDHDLGAALKHLERFYRVAARPNGDTFDPRRVAELELRYWEIHRELAESPELDKRPLVQSLADLHAALFGHTSAELWASAESRAAAAEAVDRITGHRSTDVAADWRHVEEYLRCAYRHVKELGRQPSAPAVISGQQPGRYNEDYSKEQHH